MEHYNLELAYDNSKKHLNLWSRNDTLNVFRKKITEPFCFNERGDRMIRKFSVRNFKNFKETLVLDFGRVGGYKFNTECITDNVISKCLLYGRNATGKTNLGEALTDIWDIIFFRPHR